MDQRAKGGPPPTTHTPLAPSSPPEDSEQDRGMERRRRGEGENGDAGRREEERRGAAGRTREGERGAVLELLIEGRCGSPGQRHLPFQGRETNCPEGNVRFRIGLQAKRTKKPPKILESYVCKPTIRTYQRQGRGGLLRGDGEGGVDLPGKSSPTPTEVAREQSSGLDLVQTLSKETASSALSPSSSSSSQPPLLSSTTSTSPSPASAPANPQTKPGKQVPVKLTSKTEENSDGSSERAKRDKVAGANTQPTPAGQKPSSPKTDEKATHSAPPTPSLQPPSAVELRGEGDTLSQRNGLVQPRKQKGLSNGKGPSKSTKVKVGKQSSSSSSAAAPRDMNSATRPPASSGSHKELSMSHKRRTDSPCSPTVTPKPLPSTPVALPSSAHSPKQEQPSAQPALDNSKREREKKLKKEKRKEKKSKRNRGGEAERAKSESRKEEGKQKKKKGKDGKSRHGKGKDERERGEDRRRDEVEKNEKGKDERKRDSKVSPDCHRGNDNSDKPHETTDSGDIDKTSKPVNPGRPDETERVDGTCKPAKQTEPAATGDTSKSKELDLSSKQPTMPPSFPLATPPALPPLSARSPTSAPSSPPEQDSRPLKKRKARRPSWTKLVHRAQRMENQEPPLDGHHNPTLSPSMTSKTCLPTKASNQEAEDSRLTPSLSSAPSSSPLSSATRPPSPTQSHPTPDPSSPAPKSPIASARKRGRPKSQTSSLDEPPVRRSPKPFPAEVLLLGCEGAQKPPVLDVSPSLPSPTQLNSTPRKRGRPPKRPILAREDQSGDALSHAVGKERNKDFHTEKGNRQLKIRRLIGEMKKRKRKRLHKGMLSGYGGKEGRRGGGERDRETSPGAYKSTEATATHTLSALSSSFGGKLGPQINVSKRGTIYMGKRRGRKPKAQTANQNSNSQNSVQAALFTNPSETSLFSNQPQPHPFPSPSLTHSSGAQSPYSDGSFTEPTSSLLFPHPFSLPSPSSSCTSPRPLSSSFSPFVKRSCPCQGRHHFPFHQSSCKLSSPTPPLHHTPGSPAHLKEATPSPRSESHSEETLPSDSGIGTDNNSVSERGDMRAGGGVLRIGQGSGLILGGQRSHPSSLLDRPSPVSSPLSPIHRHTHPITNPAAVERHRERERHRHRRREYDCVNSCPCLCPCPCPCPGHNKCTHVDYYPCLGHNALKRQKNKHKKKHQQVHMHDPEFLSELEDLIGQFSEVHIGRRGWARSGLGQGFDGSGNNAIGGRQHHSPSSHPLRSNIFRINLNGFYSPHPSSYSANPSFSPQPFYPCQPLHCGRKPDRRQCGCPSKFQETIDDMGFYRGYPPTAPLYPHLHSSFPLPPPHQYVPPHQPHHPHFLLNPARFHRRRSRLLREAGLGGEGEGEMGGGSGGGGSRLGLGFTTGLSCGCGRSEHKHKRKHRHRHSERDVEEEEEEAVQEEEEEDNVEKEGLANSKPRSGVIMGTGEGGRKGSRGTGSMGSTESQWLRKSGKDSFSSSAVAASATSSSSSASAVRFKHTSLTLLGLGSSHLSSFGGGWGGLGQPWMKAGGMGGPAFGLSNPSWRSFTGGQPREQPGRMGGSEREVEDEEEVQQTHLYSASLSPTHTNLFTSAAMATGARGLRNGRSSRSPGSGDSSWRREEPAWTERRGAGLQGDSSRGQQKSVPAPDSGAVKKRGPGRPRKHPLPSPVSSPTRTTPAALPSAPLLLPGHLHSRGEGGRGGDERGGAEIEGGGGGDTVQQVIDSVVLAKRKRGRKRKHSDSPCHQSLGEDNPESDAPSVCFGQSDLDQAPSQTASVQWEERADGPPRKKFQRAGLYSDDYKTIDPPSQSQQANRESIEYAPGEQEYSLLPAPIHVGKYLRLKRIDFQLPYDVLWLWRNNQLHREPAVPLKRKRPYCRLREKSVSPHHTTLEESPSDITNLFPHLDMEPLTSSERSFVVKHHVFLVRNWELVRDRQIQLRIERERERAMEGEEMEARHLSCDEANGDDSRIKSGQPVGVEEVVVTRDLHCQTQDPPSPLTASPHLTKTQNRPEEKEKKEEVKRGEEEVCRRELRRKRLSDLLLTLQRA